VFRRLIALGFDYFKLDFLYAGAIPGRRHADIAPLDAYRLGLGLIRSAVGARTTLLGCGAPLLPSIALVDAMRIGPDVARPSSEQSGLVSVRPAALTAARARAFLHGRWWVNDPDCLLARPGVVGREEWAAELETIGGLRGASDPPDDLDSWGLATTRRLMQHSIAAPVDRDVGDPPGLVW
jgi:alpha-galactosidase